MKSRHLLELLICLIITSGSACVRDKKDKILSQKKIKKVADKEYLHLNNGRPAGIIRVECKDCRLSYQINKKTDVIEIMNGNVDKFFYPKKNSHLSTSLKSNIDQMIRLIIFDPNGNIIKNELTTFEANSTNNSEYQINFTQKPNTILLKTYVKN